MDTILEIVEADLFLVSTAEVLIVIDPSTTFFLDADISIFDLEDDGPSPILAFNFIKLLDLVFVAIFNFKISVINYVPLFPYFIFFHKFIESFSGFFFVEIKS